MVEVNGVRSEPFTLTRSIRQGCPLLAMLNILALEPFLRKLKANPVLRGLTLPGASQVARYTAYADDVSVIVTSSAEVEEVSKEIGRYEAVKGAKINRGKSVSLRLGSWKGCALPGPFIWKDCPCKILGVWFGPDLQLEKNWSEVLEKVVAATELWLRRRLSLKGRAEVCCSHIYSLAVYRLSVLPISPTILFKLERILFQFIWATRYPLVRWEICYLHPSEGGLGVPNVEARRHTLRLTFLDRMCLRDTAAGSVWKEDAKLSFPLLRSVHFADGDAHRLPRRECPFYCECRHALKVLSRLQTGLSDSRTLSSRALYRCLVRGAANDGLIGEEAEGSLLWPWAPRMRCLNNDEASLTWLVIRNALWVGKKLFSVQQAISPECGRCGDLEETIGHAFFHCPVVPPLCKLLEGYMVRILNGKFFVLEASSVCRKVIPKLNRQGHYVFLCLLGVMRVVIWTTRKEELYEDPGGNFKHQIKVKLRSERKILSSLEFGERWVTVARLCRVVGASLIFSLDIPGT